MEKFKLKRTKQCAKCPFKKDTNPHDIPYGYSEKKHKALENTIAKGDAACQMQDIQLHAMACHHSTQGAEEYCVGWLYNQIGVGNNILLRLKMLACENLGELEVVGEQHTRFEDTLPESK